MIKSFIIFVALLAAIMVFAPRSLGNTVSTDAEECPFDATGLCGTSDTLACHCPADATNGGGIWGSDFYTDGSRICRAAMHSGVLGANGGVVIVRRERGRESYQGSMRFGIESLDHGAWDGSFRIIAGEGNY